MSVRLLPPTPPPPPNPVCVLLDAGHELADVCIDTEPGFRDIERLGLKLGVAVLLSWLRPATCRDPALN